MAEVKVTTYTADRQPFDIYVDGAGEFFASVNKDDHTGHAIVKDKTLKGLQAKLRKHAKQRKLQIPITLLKTPSWRDDKQVIELENGYITGVHSGNDRILYRNEEGETDTLGSHYDGYVCRRLTAEEVAETHKVWNAKCEAVARWEAHEKSLQVSPRELIDAALAAQPEPQEEAADV